MIPYRIQQLSDPIEYAYQQMADELLINIGKHISSPTWTHTASWEIQKLAQLGQLTQENAAIINKYIKDMPQTVRDTMEETRRIALEDIERRLDAAAKQGYITPAVSDSTVAVLKALQDQAVDKFNLTNTTMLRSSVDQYVRAVNLTDQEYGRLLTQEENTRWALNEAATNIASGAETRTQAVRRALRRISDEGLTGFVDKAGHKWSPEAYVNMVTRTTVHNVSIECTKARMQDYNTQVFQVSSHAGARPLCYPYQGKFLSWDNSSGMIPLGDGSEVAYGPLNQTSYGQPAGLFGINCGHFPIVVIPGVTIPHGTDNIQPPEENDKEYAESQEQRRLEREIRKAKREVEMLGDAATKEDRERIAAAQAKMREFIERTGRARRYDREQIGGGPPAQKKQPEKPKIEPIKVADSAVSEAAKNYGVSYKEVKRHAEQPSEERIIEMLSGGDLTAGSCASLGLAYCGQKAGFDVIDFRGGISQKTFSRNSVLTLLKKIPGIKWHEQHGSYFQTTGNQLLKTCEKGKEYWFSCGRHAAIVKRTESGELQYLELQSAAGSGWHGFGKTPRGVLARRFGAPSSAYIDATSYMFDVDSVKGSPEFAMILGYINTDIEEQKKGSRGTIK